MKTTALCALILSVLLVGCSKPSTLYDTVITIMIDQTDRLPVYPNEQTVLTPFRLADDPWQGLQINVVGITDKDVNTVKTVSLPKEDRLNGNITIRQAKVQHFKQELQVCLSRFDSTRTFPHSIIFRSVARQASRLTNSPAPHRYLFIYSNLQENSEISLYNPKTLAVLQQHSDLIKKQFETSSTLPSLKGIQVWFLFAPTSYRENNLYMPIARFYEQVYKAHDADVHIETQFSLP